jgi:hypothetical protein
VTCSLLIRQRGLERTGALLVGDPTGKVPLDNTIEACLSRAAAAV